VVRAVKRGQAHPPALFVVGYVLVQDVSVDAV